MIRRYAAAIAVSVALALSACTPTQSKPAAEAPATKVQQTPGIISGPGINPDDVAACKAKGGDLHPVCLMGKISCVVTYKDAGKTCTDGSQCESGQCVAEYAATDIPSEAVKGVCKQNSNPCGCFSLMADGKPTPVLCVD